MNVVVYHGDVHATQGPVTLASDTLTITLEKTDQTVKRRAKATRQVDPPEKQPAPTRDHRGRPRAHWTTATRTATVAAPC